MTTVSKAEAALPPNDLCAAAEVIPAAGPFPYWTGVTDITNATTIGDPSLPSCQDLVDRSVWYSFAPSQTAFYSISTCADAPTGTTVQDTVMAIYTSSQGCAGPFEELPSSDVASGCEDDSCGPGDQPRQAAITTLLLADTMYYIVVWRYADPSDPGLDADKTSVQLFIDKSLPPGNDTCETAEPVTLNLPKNGSTIGAVNHYLLNSSACFTGVGQGRGATSASGRDVVYSFTAPGARDYSFRVRSYKDASGYDLVVYLAAACPLGAPPQAVNCLAGANRSGVSTAEEVVCVPLAAGQQVFIFVDDNELNAGSAFTLEVTECVREVEPNDTPAQANPILCNLTGAIDPPREVDFFALGDRPAGTRLFALVDGSAATLPDFDLRVTTETNVVEYDEGDNASAFGSSSPNLAGTALPGVPVFLRVDHRNVSRGIEPYRLYTTIQPPLQFATVESEPNETTQQADRAGNNYFYGALAGPAPSSDLDTFAFDANGGDLVFVSLDGDPLRDQTPLNARLDLFDQFGNLLASANDSADTSSTNGAMEPYSPGEGIVFRATVDEGTYYVQVSSGASSTNASAGDYLLSISLNCRVAPLGTTNATPRLLNTKVTSPVPENSQAQVSGGILDSDLGSTHRLVIDWGDGSGKLTNDLSGMYNFNLTHAYADDQPTGTPLDSYPITLSVIDNAGAQASTNLSITVANLLPWLTDLNATSPIYVGQTTTVSGQFGDPSASDTLSMTLDWGDGTAPLNFNNLAGGGNFSETHQYAVGNTNYIVRLTLVDDDTGSLIVETNVIVRVSPGAATFTSIQRLSNDNIRVWLRGTPYCTYAIERSETLAGWKPLAIRDADAEGHFEFEDAAPLPPSRFYRAVTVP